MVHRVKKDSQLQPQGHAPRLDGRGACPSPPALNPCFATESDEQQGLWREK